MNVAKLFSGLSIPAAILLTALSCHVSAGDFTKKAVGTVGSDFLNLGAGARAMGMGGAYSAIAEDASAIQWNPAGLVQISKLSATFMRAAYVADINYQYAAYAHRLDYATVIAGSVITTDIGGIKHTDTSGNVLGTFYPKDQAYTLSYGRAIMELSDKDRDVSMGVSAKYIKSTILNSAVGMGVDFGIMTYYFTNIPYRLSVVMQNLGQGLKFDSQRESLPLTFRLGGSISPFKNFLLAAETVLPKGNAMHFVSGAELSTGQTDKARVNLRGGIDTQYLRDDVGGFFMGAGIGLHFFTIDYAFVPMGELGSTHRISLTFDFPYRSPVFQRKDRSIFNQFKDFISPAKK